MTVRRTFDRGFCVSVSDTAFLAHRSAVDTLPEMKTRKVQVTLEEPDYQALLRVAERAAHLRLSSQLPEAAFPGRCARLVH